MQTYFPFDSGAGANITEAQWSKMAQYWLDTGVINNVLNKLEVFADSTGMQVKVKSGVAWIKGHYFESDVEEVLAIGTADATNPRIDRVIVKLDWTANTITLAVLQGTPAASPVAPVITQNTSRWEISLAQVSVGAAATTIATGNITDERTYAPVIKPPVWLNGTYINGWLSYNSSSFDDASYFKDALGFVHIRGVVKSGSINTSVFQLPVGYRPAKSKIFHALAHDGSAYVQNRVTIGTDGHVTIVLPGNAWVSLDGINFSV